MKHVINCRCHFEKVTTVKSLLSLELSFFPGVLWLSVISEFMYIGLLAMGFLLMCVEVICVCAKREMNALKINAFAAMCTVLSGEDWGTL